MVAARSQAGRALLAATAACVLGFGSAAAEPPADGVTPWSGILPGEERDDAVAVLVVDAATGTPRPGAVLRWYAEDCNARASRYDVVLAEGVADANGVAVLPFASGRGEGHWVASGGGGTAHEYGERPPSRMELERGRAYAGRVRDAFGKPVKGAAVDLYLGCGHGPTVATTTTDETGLFRFDDVPEGEGRFWIVAEGCVATPVLPWEGFLGGRPTELVLAPGSTASGTALDPAGRPLAGVVVRQSVEPRGPVTTSDAAGRWSLPGASGEDEISLFHPLGGDALPVDRWDPRHPLRLRLSPVPARAREPVAVQVSVKGPDGKPVAGEGIALVGEDGVVREAVTEAGGEGADPAAGVAGKAFLEVPAGRHYLEPADAFAPYGFEGRWVEAKAGEELVVEVAGEPRPRLVVEGAEEGAWQAWAGGRRASASGSSRIDAKVPAVVSLGVRSRWATVEPVADGVRRATFRPQAGHRVRWPEGLAVASAELLFQGAPVDAEADGASIVTRAGGDLVLRVVLQDSAKTLDVPVRLPVEDGPAVEVRVDPAKDGKPVETGAIRLRPLLADGTLPKSLDATATDGRSRWFVARMGPDPSPLELSFARAVVRLSTKEHVPLVVRVDAPGEREVRWGPATLGLTVLDEDGKPTNALMLLDGETYRAEDGHFDLAGLAVGPHVAFVKSPGTDAPGLRWRFTVAEGTTEVEQSLKLPPVR
jgi:hypothetical protein